MSSAYNSAGTAAFMSGTSFAAKVNAMYESNASNCIKLQDRYSQSMQALPQQSGKFVQYMIDQSIDEFTRRYPNLREWQDLNLAQAMYVNIGDIHIDTTMQRQLDLHWVAKILSKFKSTQVVPIQVYVDEEGRLCAWDGQHTAVMLWLICVQALNLDPDKTKVPVNIYPSSKKSEMRECFLSLNGPDGKKVLDLIDHWMQQVFGVRIDKSDNPEWITTNKKQKILEKYDLFVTHDKFGNSHMPGAISRLQEVHKLDLVTLDWLCHYLSLVMQNNRPADEKEMVMMAHFFGRAKSDGIKVNEAYINKLAAVALSLWDADFSHDGKFWRQVNMAYRRWHASRPEKDFINPRLTKEPLHGMPFLAAQLRKSMPEFVIPTSQSNSEFCPDEGDLF